VKHPNFDLMYSISLFSRFVLDEFIAKKREYGHKVDLTLANRVVERRNMINVYLRKRACIESVRESFEFFILSFYLLFSLVCLFSYLLLVLRLFLLLDDLLELFFALFLSLPLFMSFIGLAAFPSSR
jgi:hypothetical protein